jgi:hypothetical protein
MDGEEWQGLTVRTCDGSAVGVVVGSFENGPLGGRLRVHGDHVPVRHKAGPRDGTAVFAIPRRAVVHRQRDSLVLSASLGTVRGKWLMHVLQQEQRGGHEIL